MSLINRHFLGWDKPFLAEAANWLQEHYLQLGVGSSKECMVVVSSHGIARRLRELILEIAFQEDKAFDLPQFVTPLEFLSRIGDLGIIGSVVASKLHLHLTTASLLQKVRSDQSINSFGKEPFSQEDFASSVSLAKELNNVIEQLSSGGHRVDPSTWPKEITTTSLLTDKAQHYFEDLSKLRKLVENQLAGDGYITKEQHCLSLLEEIPEQPKRIILLGTTNLRTIVQKKLNILASSGSRIEALIRAPEEKSEYFDATGCVIPSFWKEEEIEISEDSISVAGTPSSQASVLLEKIASLGEISKDELVIAVTDKDSIPVIQRQLEGHNLETRYAGGKSVADRSEVKLLKAVGDFVQHRTYASYATLIRHPKLMQMLKIDGNDIGDLDKYCNTYAPHEIEDVWHNPEGGAAYVNESSLLQLHKKVLSFIEPVLSPTKEVLRVGIVDWSKRLRSLLLKLYGDEDLDRQSKHLATLQYIFNVLDQLDSLPESVTNSIGNVSCPQIIRIVMEELASASIPEYPSQNAIDVVEWLEAMQEDAPYLFVVGMDASILSTGIDNTPLLPDSLREALSLETADRKLARDTHAIIAMQNSRMEKGHLGWIVARKNLSGDPLTPNPLLLRCHDDKQLAQRIKRLVVDLGEESPSIPPKFSVEVEPTKSTLIPIPDLNVLKHTPITRMSVTAFKDYIACPYRFWLQRVLGIKEVRDEKSELDYGDFGSLVHSALERFGHEKSIKHSTNVHEISAFLSDAMIEEVAHAFGNNPLPTILLQTEIARRRLFAFAKIQAEHVSNGWRIVDVEKKVVLNLGTNNEPFEVVGKIDRIDMNEDGDVLVLDYKTGSKSAKEDHGTQDEWRNLQLPIYRLLAKEAGYPLEKIQTGYIKIGATEKDVKFDYPDWDDAQLQCANDRFEMIVDQVKRGEYADAPAVPPPSYSEELSWICQDSGIIDSDGSEFDG